MACNITFLPPTLINGSDSTTFKNVINYTIPSSAYFIRLYYIGLGYDAGGIHNNKVDLDYGFNGDYNLRMSVVLSINNNTSNNYSFSVSPYNSSFFRLNSSFGYVGSTHYLKLWNFYITGYFEMFKTDAKWYIFSIANFTSYCTEYRDLTNYGDRSSKVYLNMSGSYTSSDPITNISVSFYNQEKPFNRGSFQVAYVE